jgi:hypothetical protein
MSTFKSHIFLLSEILIVIPFHCIHSPFDIPFIITNLISNKIDLQRRYEDGLKSFAFSVTFLLEQRKLKKTGSMQTSYISHPPYVTQSTAIHNSSSVSIEMEGCEGGRFKQYAVIQLWTAVKISPIDIHCHMQAVCGDKRVYANTVRL